ncbi:hypothetical protein CRG98_025307 [Punica granatum]|uniref:Uncharacterized protein n=1 Tax=Punica granatum TaxID=22663 RepID=A0A2I0JDH8_PUNGR|nr:hypothetical protein CRG98_025307 [Punica granatum]
MVARRALTYKNQRQFSHPKEGNRTRKENSLTCLSVKEKEDEEDDEEDRIDERIGFSPRQKAKMVRSSASARSSDCDPSSHIYEKALRLPAIGSDLPLLDREIRIIEPVLNRLGSLNYNPTQFKTDWPDSRGLGRPRSRRTELDA